MGCRVGGASEEEERVRLLHTSNTSGRKVVGQRFRCGGVVLPKGEGSLGSLGVGSCG